MEKFECKYCKYTNYYLQTKGPNIGLYCAKCSAWSKWVPKKDLWKYSDAQIIEPLVPYEITFDKASGESQTAFAEVRGPRGASLDDPIGLPDNNGPRGLLGNGASVEDILQEMKRLAEEAEQAQTKMQQIVNAFQYYNNFLEKLLNENKEEDDTPPWD